jgi:uncharacterized hydrophobic protein (TIGR00341 family)
VRLVQIAVSAPRVEAATTAIDRFGAEYVVAAGPETADTQLVIVPVPTGAVEELLETLRAAGVDERNFTVVSDLASVISPRTEALRESFAADADEDPEKLAREELSDTVGALLGESGTFVALTAISAIVAVAGILTDAAAVVVGSMVIAPLIGPAMATSVGTVLDEEDLFRRGLFRQLSGFLIAVVAATAMAGGVRYAGLIPPGTDLSTIGQFASRSRPDVLSLAVALGAGAAGAISLTSGISTALVGVMIAAALIPPIGVVGIGIAYGQPAAILGAGALVVVNLLAINLTALGVLVAQDYQPRQWFRLSDARRATLLRAMVLVVATVVVSSVLVATTVATMETTATERQMTAAIEDVIDDQRAARLLSVEFRQADGVIDRPVTGVVVEVGVTDDPPPELSAQLSRAVEPVSKESVGVDVRYVRTR